MQKSVVKVTVTGRVPVLLLILSSVRAWKEGLLEDAGVAGLVEGGDAQLLVRILFNDAEGIFVGVK